MKKSSLIKYFLVVLAVLAIRLFYVIKLSSGSPSFDAFQWEFQACGLEKDCPYRWSGSWLISGNVTSAI
jgi:hypothetical protein